MFKVGDKVKIIKCVMPEYVGTTGIVEVVNDGGKFRYGIELEGGSLIAFAEEELQSLEGITMAEEKVLTEEMTEMDFYKDRVCFHMDNLTPRLAKKVYFLVRFLSEDKE